MPFQIIRNDITKVKADAIVNTANGYKFNEQRMRKQMILLPTTDEGKPDYDYMERYAKTMFERLKLQYLQEKVRGTI